ncbi:MAG: universal stress protein [Dehalococcoidia bacterium]|nr:universal stress protein [Dehalococcoidia bacterium]
MTEIYRKVMVPLDGSELAECVLSHVKALAAVSHPGGIIFVRVVEPLSLSTVTGFDVSADLFMRIEKEERADAEKYLQGIVKRFDADSISTRAELLFGFAAEALANYARKNAVDLIVIATHGRSGISRWVWGSVADRLLRSACAPIMIVRAPGCAPEYPPQGKASNVPK